MTPPDKLSHLTEQERRDVELLIECAPERNCANCDAARRLSEQLSSARGERDHWKANHDEQVRRKQVAQQLVSEAESRLRDLREKVGKLGPMGLAPESTRLDEEYAKGYNDCRDRFLAAALLEGQHG